MAEANNPPPDLWVQILSKKPKGNRKTDLNLDIMDEAELERKQQLLQDTAKKIADIIKEEWKYGEQAPPETFKKLTAEMEGAYKQGINYDDESLRLSSIFLYFLDWKTKIVYWMMVSVPSASIDGMHWFQIGEDGKFKEKGK